jgi:sigma-B regulation protein RsbU (phosphoserine phosphatase)
MGPALLMSETRACLRTLAQSHFDVGDILTRANRVLSADTGDLRFITLAMARIDPRTRSLVYASSGQRGYLLRAGNEVAVLDSTSIPLGVDPQTIVPTAPPLTLQPGEIVTFFTDGVIEAESPGRVRFGAQRALDVIRCERGRPAQSIVQSLYLEIAGFSRYRPQRDDITIVIIKVNDAA